MVKKGEVLGPEEEYIHNPEEWIGHSFEDVCQEIQKRTYSSISPIDWSAIKIMRLIRDGRSPDSQAECKALTYLREFYNLKQMVGGSYQPYKEVKPGQEFDPSAYPEGTILKLKIDNVIKRDNESPTHSDPVEEWGVVVGYKDRHGMHSGIWTYRTDRDPRNDRRRTYRGSLSRLNYPLTVGAVQHHKLREISTPSIPRYTFKFQRIARLDHLEVVQLGKGMRESVLARNPLGGILFKRPALNT